MFPHSQATANAPARIRAETKVAHRIRASASTNRVPHRVHGEGGGHLQVGGLLELVRRVSRDRQAPRHAGCCPDGRRAWRTAASCAAATNRAVRAPRAAFSAAASNRPRRMSTQLRCSRMRWMCSGFSTSRQCRSACPKRSSASSSSPTDDGDQAEVQPAPRHVVRPIALGYRRIGLVDQRLGLHTVTRHPGRRARSSCVLAVAKFPSPRFGTRPRHAAARVRLRPSRPVSTQNRP